MAKKYLDTDGLTRVFSKMKALVSDAENAKRAKAAVITTAGTGAAYTATVPGVTELYTGLTITIIPHRVSTTTRPTLNVNSLGAKTIRQPLSTNTGGTVDGASASWLTASKPVTVRYDGSYWIIDNTRPDATNLYGIVPVENGGTGNTSVDTTPTSGSTNMVTSDGIFEALQSLKDSIKIASGSYVGDGTGTLNIKHKETIAGTVEIVRTQFRNDARKIDMGFTPAFVIIYHKSAKSQLWLFKFDLSSNNSEILTDNGIGYMNNEIYLANSFKDYNSTSSVVAEGTYDSNKGFNVSGYKYYWVAFA